MTTICRLACFLGLVSLQAFSQNLSISGVVQDGTGVIPGARVTLRDPVGAVTQVETDGMGRYRFDSLRAGSYEIGATREGFSPATRALTLTSESRTVDITLEVAVVTSSIEVTDMANRGTASGMNIPDREIPSFVTKVNAETLKELAINDLATALEQVAGVMTQVQYGVYEWYTIGGITQQSGNDFLYVDGMTLTGNRSATQLNNVQEIQVLKGPNSILYGGSGAGQGGIVNIIKKKPSALRAHDIQYRIGRWNLNEVTGGTTGSFFGMERLLYRVDSSYSFRDGWRQNGANRFNFSPSLTWLINDRMRITSDQTLVRDRYTLDAGLRIELIRDFPNVPFDRKMNPDNDFQLTRDWQNKLTYTWQVNDRILITNLFFTRRNRDQYLDAESMTYNAAVNQVNRAYLYFQHNRRPLQDQLQIEGDHRWLGMRHRWVGRYEYSDQYNFTNRTGPTPGSNSAANLVLPPVPVADFIAGTWVDTAPRYTEFPITRVDFSTNRYHTLVLGDRITPLPWLGVSLMMRRGNYQRNTHNDSYDNGTPVSRGNETRIVNNVKTNYQAGVAFIQPENANALVQAIQPYFKYETSFNPVNNIPADGSVLDPVINQTYEIGNKAMFLDGRITMDTGFRRIFTNNAIVSLGQGLFEQIGTSSAYNADVDIKARLPRSITLSAVYGFADTKIDGKRADGTPQPNAGRRFAHAPKHTANVQLGKRFRLNQTTALSVNIGGTYVGRYFFNSANTANMPSRFTMTGAFTLERPRYDIAVNLINLTDKDRYFVSQINGGGLLYPGQPFNAMVTFRYRFQ